MMHSPTNIPLQTRRRARKAKHSRVQADGLIERAWACRESDPDTGLALAEQAAQISENLTYPRGLAQALSVQGYFLLHFDRDAEAKDCLSRGLEISRSLGDRAIQADCLYRLGTVRYAAQAYLHALDHFLQAEQLYDALENRASQSEALNSIGTAYVMVDDHNQAIQFHLKAFRLREALGDKTGVACSLNNIGNAYGHFQDFQNSINYFEKCLAASRENGMRGLEATCLSNLSQSLTSLGRIAEAVEAGKASLALGRKLEHADRQCHALLCIGRAYEKGEQYEDAVFWLTEAVTLANDTVRRRLGCAVTVALGEALLSAGRITEARRTLVRAEETASAQGLLQFQAQALAGLSKVCEQEGDLAAALAHFKQFYTLEKTLSSEAADKRSQALMMQMEVEQVQKEAQFHQLKNIELAALNAALAEANQTLQAQAELLEAQGEELRAQADELQRQAAEDGLTGLANRRSLEGRLAHHFSQARRNGCPLTVVMADVDHFKQINDRFGHQIGDEVLMSVGLIFRNACRATDLAARYGGEEFVLVLPQTSAGEAQIVCERIRRTVEEYSWRNIHPDLAVTISLGLADDATASSYERLLGLADVQLYDAKHAGRNRIAFACS